MGKPKASKIDVPDPLEIIEAEKQANRTGVRTPFGSSRWEGDTQVTEFGPQMQAMQDRMFNLGMQDSQRMDMPDYMGDLGSAIAGRIGERYGLAGVAGADKPKTAQAPPKVPEQYAGPAEQGYSGTMQPTMPQQPQQPGFMSPGPPMDPGQLEELRQRMSRGNQFYTGRRIR